MKANFDISLPSIPGKSIKFKIQDIKSSAFGSQKSRFPDNKSLLTKKFVESFSNFHEPKPDEAFTKKDDDQDTMAESDYLSKSRQREIKFRTMVSDHKKFLIPAFNQAKKEERETKTSVNPGLSFSFGRAGANQSFSSSHAHQNFQPVITDNYYFTADQKQKFFKGEEDHERKPRPSAVFKNQTRKRFEDRFYSSEVPGPGSYLRDPPKTKKKIEKLALSKRPSEDMDYKRLKDVITNIVAEQPENEEEKGVEEQRQKQIKNDFMFVRDDRDRFGHQQFPIAPKLNVPGPGSYDCNDTMEQKSKKILLVQEQRKLLKQWFNN